MRLVEFHQRKPLGGHHFKDDKGNLFSADTLPELLEDIKAFRLMNGIDVGSPENDVCRFYATHAPWWVEVGESGGIVSTLDTRALEWVNGYWGEAIKFINHPDAIIRAEQCRTCPHHHAVGITKEADELRRRAMIVSKDRLPSWLGTCALHGWHCSVACQLESAECELWQD